MQPVSDSLNVSQPVNLKGESPDSLRWWFNDALLMAQRNLRRMLRSPDLVFYAVLQPVVFILLFVYVFGGAMQLPNMDYKQFLFPGIFVQTVVFGSVAATAIGVALDMQRGIMDRFDPEQSECRCRKSSKGGRAGTRPRSQSQRAGRRIRTSVCDSAPQPAADSGRG
jgi:hypothetical protein